MSVQVTLLGPGSTAWLFVRHACPCQKAVPHQARKQVPTFSGEQGMRGIGNGLEAWLVEPPDSITSGLQDLQQLTQPPAPLFLSHPAYWKYKLPGGRGSFSVKVSSTNWSYLEVQWPLALAAIPTSQHPNTHLHTSVCVHSWARRLRLESSRRQPEWNVRQRKQQWKISPRYLTNNIIWVNTGAERDGCSSLGFPSAAQKGVCSWHLLRVQEGCGLLNAGQVKAAGSQGWKHRAFRERKNQINHSTA